MLGLRSYQASDGRFVPAKCEELLPELGKKQKVSKLSVCIMELVQFQAEYQEKSDARNQARNPIKKVVQAHRA
mgnify:CR=1 FL=1